MIPNDDIEAMVAALSDAAARFNLDDFTDDKESIKLVLWSEYESQKTYVEGISKHVDASIIKKENSKYDKIEIEITLK